MLSRTLLPICLAFVLSACSSAPSGNPKPPEQSSAAPAPQPAETETGHVAFQKLYVVSRGWAPDTEPVRLESENYARHDSHDPALLGHDGRSAVWRGIYASAARSAMKTYMWSGLSGPDTKPGITPGNEDPYSPSNTSTRTFQLVYFKTDSDDAFATAQKHGGAALLKKEPNTPINYVLDWDARRSLLEWDVLYGESKNDPKLDVVVNATTGQFVRVEK
jgi:hypothetical protein